VLFAPHTQNKRGNVSESASSFAIVLDVSTASPKATHSKRHWLKMGSEICEFFVYDLSNILICK